MNRKNLFRTLFLGGVLAAVAVPTIGYAVDAPDAAPGVGRELRAHFAGRLMAVAEELGLSEDQKDQIRTILQSHKDEAQQLRTDMRTTMKALDSAIEGGADNDTIAELAIEAHGLKADGQALRKQVKTEIGAVLTPDQKAQLKAMRAERGGKRRGPHKR